jgi:hypothetical protein
VERAQNEDKKQDYVDNQKRDEKNGNAKQSDQNNS